MDEYVMKQKIQEAYLEPRAPERLVQQVILRAQAVVMGLDAQRRLEIAPTEKCGELAARALIGQLATVSKLPKGAQPMQLARQLEQQPAFIAALRGGNVAQRLNSGELLQQITGKKPTAEDAQSQIPVPQKKEPTLG